MREFGQRRWPGPAGPRVHIYAPVGEPVHRLAQAYHPVLQRWSHALRVVPSDYLHVTLAWLPAPVAAEVTERQRRALDKAVHQRMTLVGRVRVACGPVLVTSHGVRLDVTPDGELGMLAAKARPALREVFGAESVAEPSGPSAPHIALAYGIVDTAGEDDIALAEALLETRLPGARCRPTRAILDIETALIVDVDTFAVDPWRWKNARTVPFQPRWMANPTAPASCEWREVQTAHDRTARAFLAGWRDDIDIVYGLDEPDDRPAHRVAPRLGPALTFAARRALFYGLNHAEELRAGNDDLSGADHLTDWRETQAVKAVIQAGLAAHLADLNSQQIAWLADALTGNRYDT